MSHPRQHGSLGGFLAAITELDPGLVIFAAEPWTASSRAIATRALTLDKTERDHLVAVFGDDEDDDTGMRKLSRVYELQQLVKVVRKTEKDPALRIAKVIATLRERSP